MRYKSFHIKNFKGIKDTTVSLETVAGASVFAFVGLNEGGKTTILEAIHSFSPDSATSELLGSDDGSGVPFSERVPRHLLSEFSDAVSVTATLFVDAKEVSRIAAYIKKEYNIVLNEDSVPGEIKFERKQVFRDGDFKQSYFSMLTPVTVKTGSQRKWRRANADEVVSVRDAFYGFTPDIAYFPTLVFDFPKKFFLTNRGGEIDRFYRRVFQDILDYDGRGHTIAKDITRRVHDESLLVPWLSFLSSWTSRDDRVKIQQVMDRAGAAVTRLVFGRWNKIFGEDAGGKDVIISFEITEGEIREKSGGLTKTNRHDVEVSFQIKDGTRRFDVNDRSLGFRWFFAFMLFTQFRVARSVTRPLLFLFDEPASNLHAAAQQRLIDCFPEVATGEHMLAYTTHSHYMIEPKWLEQTFIVTNRSDAPPTSMMDDISLDDESLDVRVTSYRNFVNEHPHQTSYFQPVLDRLEVVPSKFDLKRQSVVVEGRSDYFIMRYASCLSGLEPISIIPGLGAGTFGALVALSVGWGLNCLFVLDSDPQGRHEQKRYVKEFGIADDRVVTLAELCNGLSQIEDLVDAEALSVIKTKLALSEDPTKSQMKRYFQESLANGNVAELGDEFRKKSVELIAAIRDRLM